MRKKSKKKKPRRLTINRSRLRCVITLSSSTTHDFNIRRKHGSAHWNVIYHAITHKFIVVWCVFKMKKKRVNLKFKNKSVAKINFKINKTSFCLFSLCFQSIKPCLLTSRQLQSPIPSFVPFDFVSPIFPSLFLLISLDFGKVNDFQSDNKRGKIVQQTKNYIASLYVCLDDIFPEKLFSAFICSPAPLSFLIINFFRVCVGGSCM